MNENINLCEILKDCPVGVEFWSPLADVVKFGGIYNNQINVTLSDNTEWYIEPNGKMEIVELTAKSFISAEIMLYPSKDQRDWSKWKCPKPKFDPKSLNPFDRVLVIDSDRYWTPALFSYLEYSLNYPRMYCFDHMARKVIPYNDETKHLVGTTDDAPEFYKYWED